jgi:hypothetical protein
MLKQLRLSVEVFSDPFPNNGCLCWFLNSYFEQMCHNTFEYIHMIYLTCLPKFQIYDFMKLNLLPT